jgi:sugar phosphate permease
MGRFHDPRPRSLARWKQATLALCLIGYTTSYLLRTNLSAVLDRLIAEFHITNGTAGIAGSLFFWTYAAGQIAAGFLADRVNPKRMMAIGMALSALCNTGIALSQGFTPILILWALNGLSLAMVWSPTFRILVNWFSAEEYRKVSVWISLPTTVGYLLSWGLIRVAARPLPWRAAFLLPAVCAGVFLLFWAAFLKPTPESAGLLPAPREDQSTPTPAPAPQSLWPLLIGEGLLFAGLAAVVQGLIKEGVNLWGPTMLTEMGASAGSGLVSAFSLLIPLFSTLGILAAGVIVKRLKNSSTGALIFLFALSMLASGAMYLFRAHFALSAALISLMMACMCGANVLITVLVPMRYAGQNISAQVAGGLNFLCYVGAGLGGSMMGLTSQHGSWAGVFLLWTALCALAIAATAVWAALAKRR